jgi:hypothetical protein
LFPESGVGTSFSKGAVLMNASAPLSSPKGSTYNGPDNDV